MILHKCTENHNHIRYSSWDTEWNIQNFLLFWVIFCHSTCPLTTGKIKILKKWKKHLEMSSFYTCIPKSQSYDVCFLRYDTRQIEFFVILGYFFPFYPTKNQKNQNFEKMEKKQTWRYHHSTQVYQKSWSSDILFLRYDAKQM